MAETSTLAGRPRPNGWRSVLGFLVAPGVAAAVASASLPGGAGWKFWPLFALGAYLPALVLGVPAWFALSRVVRPSFAAAMLAGAVVAALPWAVLVVAGGNPDNAFREGVTTVADGVRTAAGWRLVGKSLLGIAGLGALGGVVFRVIVFGWRR